MKTVYTAVADPGERPGGPAPSYLRVWMIDPSPSPHLKLCIRHCTVPENRTETYPICGDPLSRSARRSFAPLQNLRRNHCVKGSLIRYGFLVSAQKLSRIVYRCCGSIYSLVLLGMVMVMSHNESETMENNM